MYELRVAGRIDPRWAAWFADFTVVPDPDGTTLLRGTVADQAELHGLLARIRDLGLPLISVAAVPTGGAPGWEPPPGDA